MNIPQKNKKTESDLSKDLVTVQIGGLAYGGAFVGTIIDKSSSRFGKKIFIRDVAPGEIVEARIVSEKKSFTEGELLEVKTASESRTSPPCKYVGVCGGCDLQHLTLKSQRDSKRAMVEETLKRQGGLVPRLGVHMHGQDLPGMGYRKRVGLHLDQSGTLGFYRSGSGDVVQINKCLLATDGVNRSLELANSHAKELASLVAGIVLEEHDGDAYVLIKLRDNIPSPLSDEAIRHVAKTFPNLDISFDGRLLFAQRAGEAVSLNSKDLIPVGHFSQVNESGNSVLQKLVLEWASGNVILDLYAGAGNFAIPLAKRGAKLEAVEMDPKLVRQGEGAALAQNLNIRFHATSCERYLRGNRPAPMVVLDPPRAGAPEVVKLLGEAKVSRIVYVSCSLPTLTRDLKTLTTAGFKLEEVAVVDMFSQTHHTETVSLLIRETQ